MCEVSQNDSDLRRVFDWIECKWLQKKVDADEIEKDLRILKDLIVKNSDDSKLVIYIKNKAIMKEASYKLDILTPIILSFAVIVLTVFEVYNQMVNSINGFFTDIDNTEKIICFIFYIGIPALIIGGCALIIIHTLRKWKKASEIKKFYTICLNILWPQLPTKNEVDN